VLVLLLVIDLRRRKIVSYLVLKKIRTSRKLAKHSHQHLHDPTEPFLLHRKISLRSQPPNDHYVQARRAFQRRPARDFEKAGAVSGREFAVSFRNVERNAGRRAIELVLDRSPPIDCAEEFADPTAEGNCFAVGV
jgi:hypothetical protein